MLDLSHNRIEVLQFAQFAGLSGLRTVDLVSQTPDFPLEKNNYGTTGQSLKKQ